MTLASLAKSLPKPLRNAIRKLVAWYRRRKVIDLSKYRSRREFSGRHVIVAGLFGTTTGLGRAAELVALTLESRGCRVERVDLTATLGLPVRNKNDFLLPAACLAIDASDVVLVLNPDRVDALDAFDLRWLLKRCIVGHWIWEIEAIPHSWTRAVVSFDEVWAATDLVLDVIRQRLPALEGRLKVVPYAIDLDPTPPRSLELRDEVRRRFGIDDQTFVVGYSFAVGSNYCRKNPEAAVAAFLKAFPASGDQHAALFLRSNDIEEFRREYAQLKDAVAGDRRVRIFTASERLGLAQFYAAIDVYLAPSRAEGYGLNLVEAAQSGVDVITNSWRLAPEIAALPGIQTVGFEIVDVVEHQAHYSHIKNARWADPNIDEMVILLRKLATEKISRRQ